MRYVFYRLKKEKETKLADSDFSKIINRIKELSYHLLSIEEIVCDLIFTTKLLISKDNCKIIRYLRL